METNKKDKLKIVSWIIPIILTILFILYEARILIVLLFFPAQDLNDAIKELININFFQMMISNLIFFAMILSVLQMYIYWILKAFNKKKILKGIILILLPVLVVMLAIFIKDEANYILKHLCFRLTLLLTVICVPILVIGKCLLSENKHKYIKTFILVILSIYIYFVNWSSILDYAKMVVRYVKTYPMNEIISLKEEEKLDTSYLQNYTQKMARQGYLDKYDISQILEIADSKSAKININYKDEMKDIKINILNKNDEEMSNLKELLEAEYYKFNYEINEKNEVVINIERYMISRKENNEKNSEIMLSGNKAVNSVTNTYKSASVEGGYLVYDNKINLENINNINKINSMKILFVYDKELDNYVPIIKDGEEYNYEGIYSYKIYQDGMQIILKDNVELDKKDYTLRINRYNENLNVIDQKSNMNLYYYEYEPVVTEGTTITDKNDAISNIVLEIKFNSSYTVNQLRNIEVIF